MNRNCSTDRKRGFGGDRLNLEKLFYFLKVSVVKFHGRHRCKFAKKERACLIDFFFLFGYFVCLHSTRHERKIDRSWNGNGTGSPNVKFRGHERHERHEKSRVSPVSTASIYPLRIDEPFSCPERQAPTFHAFSTARF